MAKRGIAGLLAERGVHLHADDFPDRYLKSGYVLPWLPEARVRNETVSRAIAACAFAFAAGGYFTIVDGIVGPWFLDLYRRAGARRWTYQYLTIDLVGPRAFQPGRWKSLLPGEAIAEGRKPPFDDNSNFTIEGPRARPAGSS